jgi:hypothetical protein
VSKNERCFVIGAQRSGTTRLYHMLAQHPEIEMAQPVFPEPKFFLDPEQVARGPAYYDAHYFAGKAGAWLRGEKGTSYIESPAAAARIAAWYPRARILVLLRDPVERAISNYWFSVENGRETAPLAEALLREESQQGATASAGMSVSPFAYLRRGCYIDYLEEYERHFPPHQIHLVLHEQLTTNQVALQRLYAFLAVDSSFVPPAFTATINQAARAEAAPLPQELERTLQAYFAPYSQRLAVRYQLDLSLWPSYRASTLPAQGHCPP